MSTNRRNFSSPVTKDVDKYWDIGLESKLQMLRDMGYENVLKDFTKSNLMVYTPPPTRPSKKSPLDQQISFAISKEEKDKLAEIMLDAKKNGEEPPTLSGMVRHAALKIADLEKWADNSLAMLKMLEHPDYDEKRATERELYLVKLLEDAEDEEDRFLYRQKLNETQTILSRLKSQPFNRAYRVSGRVTFREAQQIRWRASKLALSVSEYMRYMLFDYEPGCDADLAMSLPARKRFYISVLSVHKDGFGNPPDLEDCPECVRLSAEIQELREENKRLRERLNGRFYK